MTVMLDMSAPWIAAIINHAIHQTVELKPGITFLPSRLSFFLSNMFLWIKRMCGLSLATVVMISSWRPNSTTTWIYFSGLRTLEQTNRQEWNEDSITGPLWQIWLGTYNCPPFSIMIPKLMAQTQLTFWKRAQFSCQRKKTLNSTNFKVSPSIWS